MCHLAYFGFYMAKFPQNCQMTNDCENPQLIKFHLSLME